MRSSWQSHRLDTMNLQMTEIENRDHHFLAMAVAQACQAASMGNAPIGAVLTSTAGKLLAQNHNRVTTDGGLLYHAEMMILLEHQSLFLANRWTTTLYTTLEPCLMCLSTALVHHVKRIVWLVDDYWAGGTRCLHGQAAYIQQNQCELVHRSIPELEHKVIAMLVAFYAQKWPAARVAAMLGEQMALCIASTTVRKDGQTTSGDCFVAGVESSGA